jgi:hypothetical protein
VLSGFKSQRSQRNRKGVNQLGMNTSLGQNRCVGPITGVVADQVDNGLGRDCVWWELLGHIGPRRGPLAGERWEARLGRLGLNWVSAH